MSNKSFFYIATFVALTLITIYLFIKENQENQDKRTSDNSDHVNKYSHDNMPSNWAVTFRGKNITAVSVSSNRSRLLVSKSYDRIIVNFIINSEQQYAFGFDSDEPMLIRLNDNGSVPAMLVPMILSKMHNARILRIYNLNGKVIDSFDVRNINDIIPVSNIQSNYSYEYMLKTDYVKELSNYNRERTAAKQRRLAARKRRELEEEKRRKEQERIAELNRIKREKKKKELEERRKVLEILEAERLREAEKAELERQKLLRERKRKEQQLIAEQQRELNELLSDYRSLGKVRDDNWDKAHALANDINNFLENNSYHLADLSLLDQANDDLKLYRGNKIETFTFDNRKRIGYLTSEGYNCTIHLFFNGKVMGEVSGKLSYITKRRLATYDECYSE